MEQPQPEQNLALPKKHKAWIGWLIAGITLLLAGATATFFLWPKPDPTPADNTEASQTTADQPAVPQPSRAEQILTTMTLEEKLGQMFLVSTSNLESGPRSADTQTTINDTQKSNLETYAPAGIIFFAGNIQNADQLKQYTSDLQSASPHPLLIATDQEGGIVNRLANAGITYFPNMAEIGATGDTGKAHEVGATYGQEMRALGFNVNLAPVSDVNTNPNNPVIGPRAFGSDPSLVASMVAAEVKGLQDNNVAATLKHFPGHGDTSTDTHTGMATVQSDLDRLRSVELIPFQAGIAAGASLILTAHIKLPNVDPSGLPATMSKPIVTDLLRTELGYTGVVMTDALDMGAIADFYSTTEVVTNCLNAGIDLLLMPADYHAAHTTLLSLVSDGTIPESRIDESVLRILNLKLSLGLLT